MRINQGYWIRSFVDRIYACDTTYDKYDEYEIRYKVLKKKRKNARVPCRRTLASGASDGASAAGYASWATDAWRSCCPS